MGKERGLREVYQVARDGHGSQEQEHVDVAQLLHDAGLHAELVKQLARQFLVYQLLHGNTALRGEL